ncbi:MAG: GDYXXLXY domain-containing protein [Chloroflexi bacterium]|nr:GDYXXLXY domain-containing protein [Chloroflexota bacterium]MYD47524.1 GDYXXLXY domain-containing protein [Chloroflexota bacterium]
MSRRVMILFFAVVAAQVIGLVVFASVRQIALTEGREVTLQTVPVDPRSLLQGDYAILDYEIADVPPWLDDRGLIVYVVLRQCGQVWCADWHANHRPDSNEVYIRGVVNDRGRLDFGIGTFFVPEGTGHIVENASDVKVVVSLSSSGNAVIKEVLVDGRPFEPAGR